MSPSWIGCTSCQCVLLIPVYPSSCSYCASSQMRCTPRLRVLWGLAAPLGKRIQTHLIVCMALACTQFLSECSPISGRSVRGTKGTLRVILVGLWCTVLGPVHIYNHSLENIALHPRLDRISLCVRISDSIYIVSLTLHL